MHMISTRVLTGLQIRCIDPPLLLLQSFYSTQQICRKSNSTGSIFYLSKSGNALALGIDKSIDWRASARVPKTLSARRHCRPESFCASGKFLRASTKLVRNQVKTSFWTVWKISRQSGNMTNNMESFQTVWKLSGNSEKFSVSLESFWTIRKIFGQSGEFPDSLKGFRTVWKYAGHSGKFPDGLLSFRRIWKVVGRSGRFPTNLESF